MKTILALLFVGVVTGCTPQSDIINKTTLTQGAIRMTVKVGQTTKTEVIEKLGSPNITSLDAQGHEVWTYQKHATTSKSNRSESFRFFIIFGRSSSNSGFESTQRTFTLIIKFNEKGIVKDFRSQSSSF